MDTRDSRPNPQGLVSQDGDGLWMKGDINPVTDHKEKPSVTCREGPQEETKVIPSASAVITRYYSVMDDEGVDDVFIPPPPSVIAPVLPAEGSRDATANNSSVTLTNVSADATEAKANPSDLERHHGEKQLMAAHDEVKANTAQICTESLDTTLLSKDKDSTLPKEQDRASMEGAGRLMETCYDPSERKQQDNTTEDKGSSNEPTDIKVLTGGQESWRENEAVRENPKQGPQTGDDLQTNAPRPPGLSGNVQPQMSEIQTEVSSVDEDHVDCRSVNSVTKYDELRTENGCEETMTTGEQSGENMRIATDIQQGQQLLERLQQVQLRQDASVSESSHTSQQAVQETRGKTEGVLTAEEDNLKAREQDLTVGVEKREGSCDGAQDEGAKTNLTEREKITNNDNKDASRMSPVEPEHQVFGGAEAGVSKDDQSMSLFPADLSPIDPHGTTSTQIPLISAHHRFSASEDSIEKQIQEAAQGKQNLQRAGGVFNLTDNPDVLEIPFKTNVTLEPLSTKVDPSQQSDWQFSGQKMQKEISQEIQRELVLVNQGKIPGGYSKGEVRQLKETKLLFEAFQQDNTVGPTKYRKPPTLLTKGHVYPSVLERTRSLEMFSLKSRPISRAQSLRLYKSATSETDKSPDDFRSKSPTGGSRDKTRLSPYPKQDKHVRMHRSMDSISTGVGMSAGEMRDKTRDGNTGQDSPILKHNPFYKLRPALALQPEVEKDIREAKEREEELRRQRCTLYGENWQSCEGKEKSQLTPTTVPDIRRQSRGKLERVWPPPSKTDQLKSEQTQEPKVQRGAGQKAPLWQRWESGLVNGQLSEEKK